MREVDSLWERWFRLNAFGIAVAVAEALQVGKVARRDTLTSTAGYEPVGVYRVLMWGGFLTGSMRMLTRGHPRHTR